MFGYPQGPATHVALDTVKKYLETDDNVNFFDGIVFNVFKYEDLVLYGKHVRKYFGVASEEEEEVKEEAKEEAEGEVKEEANEGEQAPGEAEGECGCCKGKEGGEAN
jgi:hypothetical protein